MLVAIHLPLFFIFAHTEYRPDAVANSCLHLESNIPVVLVEDITSFAVTDQDVLRQPPQLTRRYFTGKSTFVSPVAILRPQLHLAVIDLKRYRL